MTCLSGAVDELRYAALPDGGSARVMTSPSKHKLNVPGVLADQSPCPVLTPLATNTLDAGHTAHINDALGLHAVRCGSPLGGVTLHVYSPPIRLARLFEPEWDRVSVRVPGHVSVGGTPVWSGSANTALYGPSPLWDGTAAEVRRPPQRTVNGDRHGGDAAASVG